MDRAAVKAAAEAVNAARAAGVHLRVDGNDLVLEASSPPPPAVVDLLREKKDAVVALLHAAHGGWSGEDWQAFFDERASIAEFDGGQARATAEETALECCLVEWMNRHPERSDPGRCAGCNLPERHGRAVVPFGTGPHVWLHPECWHEWYRSRREEARQALTSMGLRIGVTDGAGSTGLARDPGRAVKRAAARLLHVGSRPRQMALEKP